MTGRALGLASAGWTVWGSMCGGHAISWLCIEQGLYGSVDQPTCSWRGVLSWCGKAQDDGLSGQLPAEHWGRCHESHWQMAVVLVNELGDSQPSDASLCELTVLDLYVRCRISPLSII